MAVYLYTGSVCVVPGGVGHDIKTWTVLPPWTSLLRHCHSLALTCPSKSLVYKNCGFRPVRSLPLFIRLGAPAKRFCIVFAS